MNTICSKKNGLWYKAYIEPMVGAIYFMFSLICPCRNFQVDVDIGKSTTLGPYKKMGACFGMILAWISKVKENPQFVLCRPDPAFARSLVLAYLHIYRIHASSKADTKGLNIQSIHDFYGLVGLTVKTVQSVREAQHIYRCIAEIEGPSFFVFQMGLNLAAGHAIALFKFNSHCIYVFDPNHGVYKGPQSDFFHHMERVISTFKTNLNITADLFSELIYLE